MEDKSTKSTKSSMIGDIAALDPKLAYTLAKAHMVTSTGCIENTGGWEIINVFGQFNDTAANKTVKGQLFGVVAADEWVRRVTYTVRRPRAFAGNGFKGQWDYFNRLNPNIDFTLLINSYCRYTISPEFTPLENIETVFECVCPAGLILRCSANLLAEFQNLRALAEDEIPTQVVISFHSTRLPNGVYGGCDEGEAVDYLRKCGYCP